VYPLHGRGEYFFTPVRIGDKAFIAKMTVKETKIAGDSNPLYTVDAVTFDEVIRPAVSWVDASAAADGIDLTSNRPARLVKSIADSVQKYNDAEVSKIVDANGVTLPQKNVTLTYISHIFISHPLAIDSTPQTSSPWLGFSSSAF